MAISKGSKERVTSFQQTEQDLLEANHGLLLAGIRAEEQRELMSGELLRLNALFESLHEAVTITDSTGRMLSVNPAARSLWGILELTGDPSGLLPAVDQRHLDNTPLTPEESPLARALRGERFSEEESILVRPDGTRLRLLSSGNAVRAENGSVVLAILIHRDVTALRLLEAEHAENLRLEGVLLAARTIEHELNNKLAVITGYTEILLLRDELRGTPEYAELLTLVLEASEEAAASIRGLSTATELREKQWGAGLGPTLKIEGR